MKTARFHKIILLSDQGLISGINFLITVLLARHFGLSNYGTYAGTLLALYFVMNIGNAIIVQPFQINIHQAKKDTSYTLFVLLNQFALIVLTVLAGSMAVVLLSLEINLWMYLPITFGLLFHDVIRKIMLALNQIKTLFIVDFLLAALQAIVITVCIKSSIADIEIYVFWNGIAYVFPLLLSLLFLSPFSFRRQQWKAYVSFHIKEGKWFLGAAIVQWWSTNLFVVASGLYISLEALGALRLCQTIFGVFNILLMTFENYVLPQTALKINNDQELATNYLGKVSRQAFYLFLPVLALLFVGSSSLLELIGGTVYTQYDFLVKGMVFLYILIFLNQPVRIAIRALILSKHFFIGYSIALVFSLLFSDFLLQHYGLYGALIGLFSSQLILFIYWQYLLIIKKFTLWKSFISY